MTIASTQNDQDLLARLQTGDKEAFAELVQQYGGRMLVVARGILRHEEDAADAVQDAFLSAFKALDRFESQSSLSTWLHRIVVNASLMRSRSRSRRRLYSVEELLPTFDSSGHHAEPVCRWSESAFDQLVRDESKRQIRECIEQLPDDYREVLILRDIQQLDTDEVATILKVNSGVVKTRLHRARQALRTLLTPLLSAGK